MGGHYETDDRYCLFAAVMLFAGGLCGKSAFDAERIRTAEETEAVTEDAAVTQTERTAESMQVRKPAAICSAWMTTAS